MANARLGGAKRTLIATIGDEGHVTSASNKKNFMVVDSTVLTHDQRLSCNGFFHDDTETSVAEIQKAFDEFTTERDDIAIVLINQHVADKIRPSVDKYEAAFPALLEIPSKDHPYDPEKDSVLKRVKKLFGE
ncbi:V-type ATPase, F subunit [Puccinia sorghi]|uniref:V-type proton ATPase subunit F n=1 Tax=Puccinia sorghi TaxID=27349 RepID=A0A0L6VKP0_9BASI|nr:V-type ATPase, F subunit [Puccinia sorghi]